uniref:Uncharacterized protein n=1 Tax=Ditylum brightwellii TaxID=49249 RepID=A0A7S1YUA7_9STRA|mmetsp:Transcript_17685/g.26376  ORF Transcript_17685/g.26376 Transcript_17685/m.26376 type:complete len:343 (+) Transcript_17685:91-1119(+)
MSFAQAHKSSSIVDQAIRQNIPPTPSTSIDATETCCTKQEQHTAIFKHPIHVEHEVAVTKDSWCNRNRDMQNKLTFILKQATKHQGPPTPSINIDTPAICYTKNKQEKQTVISKRPVYIEREAGMAEDSWYNTYVEMANKRERNNLLQMDTKSSAIDDQDALEMIRTYKGSDLRANLLISQQGLYMYHELLEDIFKTRQHNEQLECLVLQLQQKQHRQLLRFKKKSVKKIHSLKSQIAQLKVELAELQGREDHHSVEVQKALDTKNILKTQRELLRLKTSQRCPQVKRRAIFQMRDQLLPSFSAKVSTTVSPSEGQMWRSCPKSSVNCKVSSKDEGQWFGFW